MQNEKMSLRDRIFAPRRKNVIVGSQTLTLYSIAWFAKLINRSAVQIRRWESAGLFPSPLVAVTPAYEDGIMFLTTRWYLAAELIGYAHIVQRCGVRAGKSIEKTTDFKGMCFRFRAKLRKQLEAGDPMLAELPEEDHIMSAMMSRKHTKWAEEVRKIKILMDT